MADGQDRGGRREHRRTSERADDCASPGSTIGILGGGQLGRMLAHGRAQLGLRCHIYSDVAAPPSTSPPATTRALSTDVEAHRGASPARSTS